MSQQCMNTIASRITQGFDNPDASSREFKAFARNFKTAIKKELQNAGAELVKLDVDHFYITGFYSFNGKLGYFSLPDVRFSIHSDNMMFRTAEHERDFQGGPNNWARIADGIGHSMTRILS